MKKTLPWYAVGHFAVDFLCAFLVFGRMSGHRQWLELALVYNFCAFALQMPLGILADRLGRNRLFAATGGALVLLAAIPVSFWWTIVLAGLGNALYHVGGGRETLLCTPGYGGLGVFVAPGAVGIFLGSSLRGAAAAGFFAAGLLAVCSLVLLGLHRQEVPSPRPLSLPGPRSLGILLMLFLVVFLRSLVGMTLVSPWKTGLWVVLGALLGAAGKALGGVAADRFGGGLAGAVSLFLAAFLFLFPQVPICGILAGLAFNMSMPITLRQSAGILPGGEGFAFGLLTFALFLGFLPAQWGLCLSPWQGAALAAVSGLGLLLSGRRCLCTT